MKRKGVKPARLQSIVPTKPERWPNRFHPRDVIPRELLE